MKTRFFIPAASLAVLLPCLGLVGAAAPDSHFVAHEWGTFTSVQGADGEQVPWFGPVSADLPSFVYRPELILKSGIVSRQRMETPVIYFYSERERSVNVSVYFPEGQVTEWYPLKTAAVSQSMRSPDRVALWWPEVRIHPSRALDLPVDTSGSHYYSARETDAALLSVPVGPGGKNEELEKFLFYRGSAGFIAPLNVRPDRTDATLLHLKNTGPEPLQHLFLCDLDGRGGGQWLETPALQPGEERAVRLHAAAGARPLTEADLTLDPASLADRQRLGTRLVSALVGDGLFEKEATAMVKTWKSSWFSEKGTRVLYTLPRAWTDRTLPLKITPAPGEVARVMVARAEVITPARELALRNLIERYAAAEESDRPPIVAETRALALGRFADAALQSASAQLPRTEESQKAAWELIQIISAPAAPSPDVTTAAK